MSGLGPIPPLFCRRTNRCASGVDVARASASSAEAGLAHAGAAVEQANADVANAKAAIERSNTELEYASNNLHRIDSSIVGVEAEFSERERTLLRLTRTIAQLVDRLQSEVAWEGLYDLPKA
jgi:multidrug efflux system membrane fusion protein